MLYPKYLTDVRKLRPQESKRAASAQQFVLGNFPFVWEFNLAFFSVFPLNYHHFPSSNKF